MHEKFKGGANGKVDFIRVIYHTGENIRNGVKILFTHSVAVSYPCPSPSKFNIVSMENGPFDGQIGYRTHSLCPTVRHHSDNVNLTDTDRVTVKIRVDRPLKVKAVPIRYEQIMMRGRTWDEPASGKGDTHSLALFICNEIYPDILAWNLHRYAHQNYLVTRTEFFRLNFKFNMVMDPFAPNFYSLKYR